MSNQINQTPLDKEIDYNKVLDLGVVNGKYNNAYRGYFNLSINDAIKNIKLNILECLNLPVKYKDYTFEDLKDNENKESFLKFKEITEKGFLSSDNQNVSVILWSKGYYGVGKTHLLYAEMKIYALLDKNIKVNISPMGSVVIEYIGKSVKILSEYELLDMLRETFKQDSQISEGDIFLKLNKFDILCLDDVLKYTPNNLDFYQRTMFRLIDERYKNNKSIVLTTNKSLKEITDFIGFATADRLSEMTKGYRFEFRGESYRAK